MVEIKTVELPQPGWRIFLNKIKPELKLLIVFTLLFCGYLYYNTELVPNMQYKNMSDPNSIPKVFTSNPPAGYTQVVLYKENDLVPRSPTPNTLLIGYFIFIIILVIFITNKKVDETILTDEEARDVIKRRWRYWQTNKNPTTGKPYVEGHLNLYEDIPKHTLRTKEDATGKKTPFEWVIPGIATTKIGQPYYVLFGVNPYDGQITRSVTTSHEFSRKDVCPKCGEYSDLKIIETEELQRFRSYMKGMGEQK